MPRRTVRFRLHPALEQGGFLRFRRVPAGSILVATGVIRGGQPPSLDSSVNTMTVLLMTVRLVSASLAPRLPANNLVTAHGFAQYQVLCLRT